MERSVILGEGLSRQQIGIEVAPWASPIFPKADGWNVLSLDIFPTEVLIERARADHSLGEQAVGKIEPVDLVGPAQEIGRLVSERGLSGSIDYIVSSHNFEHLPDPIAFLQGCQSALRPGGQLAMAIPDVRGCFDYFKPLTTTVDVLTAHRERRTQPPREAKLQQRFLTGRRVVDGQVEGMFFVNADPNTIDAHEEIEEAYRDWIAEKRADGYQDAHCWAFQPASLELIVRDLAYLGLTNLWPRRVLSCGGGEFYIWLDFKPDLPQPDRRTFYDRRRQLLHAARDEAAVASGIGRKLDRALEQIRLAGEADEAWHRRGRWSRLLSAWLGER